MVRKLIKADKKSVLILTTIILTGLFVFGITPLSYAQTETAPKAFNFYNPYKRLKNGPTLKNVTWKVNSSWIHGWIKNTKVYDPGARMPFLMLEDDEVNAIMAYLASIADKNSPNPKVKWDDFLFKPEAELSDAEFDKVDSLLAKGQGVWSNARCGLCHAQKGIGGFVPVAPDLGKLQLKITNRDWLHFWISNPRDHFLDTMMPQFKMPDEDLKALIEYIVRSEDFAPEWEDEEEEEEEGEEEEEEVVVQTFSPNDAVYSKDAAMIAEGKRLVTISRCVVCHDLEGITEVLPVAKRDPVPTEGFHKLVYEKRCLTCHNINGEGGTFAPPWDPEGSKLKASWVANFLQTPDIIRPILQQMPKLGITEEEAKSAVDFIESNFTMPPFGITEKEAQTAKDYIKESFVVGDVPTDLFKEGEVNETRAEKGKKFYDEYGCNACHAIGPVGGVIGPSLTNAGDRLEPNWVYWHLKNSRHAALDTVEPLFKLTDAEITNLVHFLMTCTKKGTS